MRVSERLLLIFYGLLAVSLSLCAGVAVWYSQAFYLVFKAIDGSVYMRIAISGVLLVIAFIAVRAMFVGVKKEKSVATLAASTPEGGIYINIDTVSDLAVKAVKKVESVREVKVRTSISEGGADIAVKVSMNFEAVIPEVSSLVQQSVKSDIETLCGIKVSRVTVQVDNSFQTQNR